MDDTRAAALRARLDAATPGPWMIADEPKYPQCIQANDGGLVLVAETYTDPSWPAADADLIAHATADLADLLDEREVLIADRQSAEQVAEDYREEILAAHAERDRLLAVVDATCAYVDARVGAKRAHLDTWTGANLIAAVRAYRATTGEAGQ